MPGVSWDNYLIKVGASEVNKILCVWLTQIQRQCQCCYVH